MKLLVLTLLSMWSLYSFSYDSCESPLSIRCNSSEIDAIEKQLQLSLAGSSDIFIREIIKNRLREKYDEYLNNLVHPIINNQNRISEIEMQQIVEAHKVPLDNMRISLALFQVKPDPHQFSFRKKDMYHNEISHFSFIVGAQIENLSERDKEKAEKVFRREHKNYFSENNIPTEVDGKFENVLKINNGNYELRNHNKTKFRKHYLEAVLGVPALRYVKVSSDELTKEHLVEAYKELQKEIEAKKQALFEITDDELDQLFLHDSFMDSILIENSFFCESAKAIKSKLVSDRNFDEMIYGFGGLALCPFTGWGCAGAMFGGSIVNFLDEKKRLDTSLKFAIDDSTLTEEELSEQTKSVGMKGGMVLLSAPVGGGVRVGWDKLGGRKIVEKLKEYRSIIQEEGGKRVFIRQNVGNTEYRLFFKRLSDDKPFIEYLDRIIQAPVVGVSKLATGKQYIFKPAEFTIRSLEKRFLKEGEEFTELVKQIGRSTDFQLFVYGYSKAYQKGMEYLEGREELKDFAQAYFLNLDTDPRFEKLRQIKESCQNSNQCRGKAIHIFNSHMYNLIKGSFKLENLSLNLHKQGLNLAEQVDKIAKNPEVMSYASYTLPYFSQTFPDYDPESKEPLSDKQKQVLIWDLIKIKVSKDLKAGELDKFLNGSSNVSPEFISYLRSSPNAQNFVEQLTGKELTQAIANDINSWVAINQKANLE